MAIQFIPLIVSIVGGAATVGAGVVAYQHYVEPPAVEEAAPIALKQPEAAPKPEPKIEVVEEKPELPKFQLLRVEKDGSAVIAGSAPAASKVEILLRDGTIAKATASSNGDFAIVLDNPLKPGDHELFIRATTDDGTILQSAEAGVVHIPEKGGELLAMVSKPGAASKLIQKPEPEAKPIAKPVVEPAPKPKVKVEPAPVEVAIPTKKPVEVTKIEPKEKIKPVAKPIVPVALKPVLVEAVEVEKGEIFLAGTGEPGHTVNLYLDSLFLGGALVGKEGAYLLEVKHDLKFGMHKIRADMLEKNSTQVVARAQVPLLHEAPAPKPVIVVEAKPDAPKTVTRTLKPAPVVKPIPKIETVRVEAPKAQAPKAPEPKVETAKVEVPKAPEPKIEIAKVEISKPAEPIVDKPKRIIRTGSSVIIRRGDSLWRVSRRTLGQGIRYSTIYDANRTQIQNPNLIFPGQIFKIPEKLAGSNDANSG